MLARVPHGTTSALSPLRTALLASGLGNLGLTALLCSLARWSAPREFLAATAVLLSPWLCTTLFVGIRNKPGRAFLRACAGGLLGGLLAAWVGIALLHHYFLLPIESTTIIGTLLGLVFGPLIALLEYPVLVSCLRARAHPAHDAADATLCVAGAWLAFVSAVFAGMAALTQHPRLAYVPASLMVLGLATTVLARRRVSARIRFVARVRGGQEPSFRIVPAVDVAHARSLRPLLRADFDPAPSRYDGVLVGRGDDYRSADVPLACVTLAADPSSGEIASYYKYPTGKRDGARLAALVILPLALLLGAVLTFAVLR